MGKILIIPDVHGREFWKEPCKNLDSYEKVIFLGDYVSPYPTEDITNKQALTIFKEILKLKKENKEKVILLLGNHDFSYLNINICECRTDYVNYNALQQLFLNNLDLFDLAYETTIQDIRYFFSHAGVRKEWFDIYVKDKWFEWDSDALPNTDYFNNALHVAYQENSQTLVQFESAISIYSGYRGWSKDSNGSIVWADAREFIKESREYDNVIFICGHTQLKDRPIVTEGFVDLDVRNAFILDTESGKIEEFVEN